MNTDRIIPVVVLRETGEVREKLSALCRGGIMTAEITFRTPCARDALVLAAETFPEMKIGAGTVIDAEQCRSAIDAGAKFVVSPGFSGDVREVCRKRAVPYYPGCATPSEIMRALESELSVIKFFPAQIYGGLNAIKALAGPFPQVRFIPTGGIDNSNLSEYLNCEQVFAVGGSWMMKGDTERISREAMEIAAAAEAARGSQAK